MLFHRNSHSFDYWMDSVEGYIMDYFCIDRGTLLDNPSVRTLEGPGEHSVHW